MPNQQELEEFKKSVMRARARSLINHNLSEQEKKEKEWSKTLERAIFKQKQRKEPKIVQLIKPKITQIRRDIPEVPTIEQGITNNQRFTDKKLDLYDVGTLFEEELGVIGERKSVYRIILNTISKKSFILVGPSGSGKTTIADNLASLLPEDLFYEIHDTKKQALFQHAEKFHKKILYFPEIQTFLRGSGNEKDALRTICEGKPYFYFDKTGNKITLDPLFIFSAVAESNTYWKKYLMDDPEFKRRIDFIYTDKSLDKINNIKNAKNRRRAGIRCQNSSITKEDVSAFLRSRMIMEITDSIIDPNSAFVNEYFPKTFMALSYIENYKTIEDAILKWHIDEDRYEVNGNVVHILGLKNKYRAERIAREEICRSLREFDNVSYAKEELKWSDKEISELERSIEKSKEEINWQVGWETYLKNLREAKAPSDLISEVIDRHFVNGKLIVDDPITGNTVVLAEYSKSDKTNSSTANCLRLPAPEYKALPAPNKNNYKVG